MWNLLIFASKANRIRVNGPYLQVSLYISSGVCGKGSVFFFEPGLERGLTALQSNAGREKVFQSFSTTFTNFTETGGDSAVNPSITYILHPCASWPSHVQLCLQLFSPASFPPSIPSVPPPPFVYFTWSFTVFFTFSTSSFCFFCFLLRRSVSFFTFFSSVSMRVFTRTL